MDEVATVEGIDRTVAFEHLEMLVRANLASKQRVNGRRGRPLNAYRYLPAASEQPQPAQRSQLLANLLAQSLAAAPDGAQSANRVGRRFGATMGSLERLGGRYLVDESGVHALSCMFEGGCSSSREVVCSLHAGLIEGAMAAGGRQSRVTPVGPDGRGGCTFLFDEEG